jgi:hypothetical protein
MNTFNVWIDYTGPRFENRHAIERAVGSECHGGGGCLGSEQADCSWHGISESEANRIAETAKKMPFVLSVEVYEFRRSLNR